MELGEEGHRIHFAPALHNPRWVPFAHPREHYLPRGEHLKVREGAVGLYTAVDSTGPLGVLVHLQEGATQLLDSRLPLQLELRCPWALQ